MEKNVEEKRTDNISFISKSEEFIEKNKNLLIGIAIAIVVVVLAIFGAKKLIFEPREQKANEAIFVPSSSSPRGTSSRLFTVTAPAPTDTG